MSSLVGGISSHTPSHDQEETLTDSQSGTSTYFQCRPAEVSTPSLSLAPSSAGFRSSVPHRSLVCTSVPYITRLPHAVSAGEASSSCTSGPSGVPSTSTTRSSSLPLLSVPYVPEPPYAVDFDMEFDKLVSNT